MKDDDKSNLAWCITFVLFLISVAMLFSMLFSVPVRAGTTDDTGAPAVSVCWDAPTQRVDGTKLDPTELQKYEIEHYFGSTATVHEVPSISTSFETVLAGWGDNCFRVRVFDTKGLASVWTEQKCVTVLAPPAMIRFKQC